MREAGLAYRTEQTYVHWKKRFLHFHKLRHPREVGIAEVEAFLNHLSINRHCSVNTQRIALNALVYLYNVFWGLILPTLALRLQGNIVAFQLFTVGKRLESLSQS
ncbi:site-specific integrase [Microbulbifer sp. PSTR4-B]|uniref:site-specific integrase n=1 Tax=Microbulbifer sp. PSTR4-B TaxID=3243396 RepID=UPI00403A13A8